VSNAENKLKCSQFVVKKSFSYSELPTKWVKGVNQYSIGSVVLEIALEVWRKYLKTVFIS
jgi:hypothetical protein